MEAHRRLWGEPEFLSRAPGRVNLIGEHTDYNDGFVLPMALPFDTVVAVTEGPPHSGVEIESEGFGRFELTGRPAGSETGWELHIHGAHRLTSESVAVPSAWRATIASDVPVGAGLSSSAALDVAMIRALLRLAAASWTGVDVARLARRVENEIVGIPSGIMDQLVSASAVAGSALLIDCRSLETTPHRLPDGAAVAVMDTGTRRRLADSAYAERRKDCLRAAALLGVNSLRDATSVESMPPGGGAERERARHVISENQRTLDAVAAIEADDASRLGHLMTMSHASLRDDYAVSGAALDQIVTIAAAQPGCFGARMTGGGFAGCAVALVGAESADSFRDAVVDGYRNASGRTATVWVCEAGAGASVVELTP